MTILFVIAGIMLGAIAGSTVMMTIAKHYRWMDDSYFYGCWEPQMLIPILMLAAGGGILNGNVAGHYTCLTAVGCLLGTFPTFMAAGFLLWAGIILTGRTFRVVYALGANISDSCSGKICRLLGHEDAPRFTKDSRKD